MAINRILKKIARAILNVPEKKVNINLVQANYDNILKNKCIVILGGSSGIGFEITNKCHREGAKILISGTNLEKIRKAQKQIGNCCYIIQHNVVEYENAHDFIKKCENLFHQTIDCLIYSAGVSLHEGNYKNVTIDGFDEQFNINMKGAYFLSKAFLEYKEKSKEKGSNLLIISSETANQCYDVPYGMTKASLNSMIGAFSRRVYKKDIRVNGIAPGVTATDMTKEYADVDSGDYSRSNSAGRVLLAEEIAEVAVFLLSENSKCISGEVIHCNAGNHLKAFWDISN